MHHRITFLALVACCSQALVACHRHDDSHTHAEARGTMEAPQAPSNRIDIPPAVRQNLGMTFAKVEYRSVARTLRVPGSFELLPTARREYHAPLEGRIEIKVHQYHTIEPGTVLYTIDAPSWRDLAEQITATQAKVDSMDPLREAHRRHEQSLADKVGIWQERLTQLEELRVAGGGSSALLTDAKATLNATQAELADVMEKDAQLQAEQMQAQASLRSLLAQQAALARGSACAADISPRDASSPIAVCAIASGVVESLHVTQGALVEEHAPILTLVQPSQLRFRARALQSDSHELQSGLAARIVPSSVSSMQDTMQGSFQLGLSADAQQRTMDLIVIPATLASWARDGIAAQLEVTLAQSSHDASDLAIPASAVVRDGVAPIIFRRDPEDPDRVIRMEADLGLSDGRWIVIHSGVKEGDEIVVAGNYQLMLASSGSAAKGGHFHPDGTFHDGEDH